MTCDGDTHEANIVRTEGDPVDVVDGGVADSRPEGGLGLQTLHLGLDPQDVLVVILADGVADAVGRLGAEGVPHQVHLVLGLLAYMVHGVLQASHVGEGCHLTVTLGAQQPAVQRLSCVSTV